MTKEERVRYDRIRSALRYGVNLEYGDMFFLKSIVKDLPVQDVDEFKRFCNMNEVNILSHKPIQGLKQYPFLLKDMA